MADVITEDGEVLEAGAIATLDSGVAAEMMKAEISQQIATARQYPRSVKKAVAQITSLATLDEEAAAECIYALPRGGKPIRGPSIRLAEIVAQQWGNNRVGTRVIDVDRVEKVIVAEAVFHDLETNAAVKATVRRSIADKNGRLFSADMIVVTGNAASSIARRNAVFAGVPKAVWRKAHDAAENVIKGDVQTLSERRDRAVKSFATWGVKPEQVYGVLGVAGEEEITLDHLPTLFGMFQAIKNGEATVEEMFDPRRQAGRAEPKPNNPLRDDGGAKPRGADMRAAAADHIEGEDGQVLKSKVQEGEDRPPATESAPADPAPAEDAGEEGEREESDPAAQEELLTKLRAAAARGGRKLKLAIGGLKAPEQAVLATISPEVRAELEASAEKASSAASSDL